MDQTTTRADHDDRDELIAKVRAALVEHDATSPRMDVDTLAEAIVNTVEQAHADEHAADEHDEHTEQPS